MCTLVARDSSVGEHNHNHVSDPSTLAAALRARNCDSTTVLYRCQSSDAVQKPTATLYRRDANAATETLAPVCASLATAMS